MSTSRCLLLIFGPPLLVGACYWAAMADSRDGFASWERVRSALPSENGAVSRADLEAACRSRAETLAARLGPECRALVRAPYVLAGDLTESELDRHYRQTIRPTARALSTCYFDRPPDEPISVLLFSGEAAYEGWARRLDGDRRSCYSGYYVRQDRRIVVNIATGSGTLAHELTHALAHFDFPQLPEWLDEGLASLHEECEFSRDGLRLIGRPNWRRRDLLTALRRGTLPPLEALIGNAMSRDGNHAVDYAQARSFCLYLQHRHLLSPYYRKLRSARGADPTGLDTLKGLLHVDSLESVQADFRRWVLRGE